MIRFFSEGRGGDAPSLRRLPSVGVDPAEGRAVAEEGRGQDQRGGEFPRTDIKRSIGTRTSCDNDQFMEGLVSLGS
jgi:hypothetical protein